MSVVCDCGLCSVVVVVSVVCECGTFIYGSYRLTFYKDAQYGIYMDLQRNMIHSILEILNINEIEP